jgi:hypothetical protein
MGMIKQAASRARRERLCRKFKHKRPLADRFTRTLERHFAEKRRDAAHDRDLKKWAAA